MSFRHFFGWKRLFYHRLLPLARTLGPERGDALIGGFGWFLTAAWPPRRRELSAAVARVQAALRADWDSQATVSQLAGHALRFLARDCTLDGVSEHDFAARFEVIGEEHLRGALDARRGVILVGCHLGSHLSAMHWMYRNGVPLRLLIQRVPHCSKLLQARFDVADGPHPQAGFFVRRHQTPEDASKRLFRTRAALRDGLAVYLKGDVPWVGPNTRKGRFLGQERTFQSLWADMAALFRVPVIAVFCTHLPGGRFRLTFDAPFTVARGAEDAAVARYLERLEAEIAANPADAVAHLLWPCYGPADAPIASEADEPLQAPSAA